MAKVCFVTSSLVGPTLNGGVGTAMYYQALLLEREGYEVTILFNGAFQVKDADYWEKKYRDLNINFRYLPNEVNEYQKPIKSHNWWVWRSFYVMKWLEDKDFDIVHFSETCAYAYHTIQAKRTSNLFANMEIVVTMHSPTEWIYEGDKRWPFEEGEKDRYNHLFLKLNYAERYVCQYADLLLAPSKAVFDWAIGNYWKLSDTRKVIFNPYLGCRSDDFEKIDSNHLIFFGTLNKGKGIDYFCKAICKYSSNRESVNTLKVSFLGRNVKVDNTDSNRYIDAKLAGLNIDIEIHNDYDTFAANEYIKRSGGIVILCSNLDNSPYSVVECIENKIPFICSNVGGIPEMVDDKVLFSPSATGLYDKLMGLEKIDWKSLTHRYNADVANVEILNVNDNLLKKDNNIACEYHNEGKVSVCIATHNQGEVFGRYTKQFIKKHISGL